MPAFATGQSKAAPASLFGKPSATSSSTSAALSPFGQQPATAASSGNIFGQGNRASAVGASPWGGAPASTGKSGKGTRATQGKRTGFGTPGGIKVSFNKPQHGASKAQGAPQAPNASAQPRQAHALTITASGDGRRNVAPAGRDGAPARASHGGGRLAGRLAGRLGGGPSSGRSAQPAETKKLSIMQRLGGRATAAELAASGGMRADAYGDDGDYGDDDGEEEQEAEADEEGEEEEEEGEAYDEDGNAIEYDEDGNPVEYDEDGNVIEYDEDGNAIQYDEDGNVIEYDEDGNVIQYDEDGNAIQYDEDGNAIQYDEDGDQGDDDQGDDDQGDDDQGDDDEEEHNDNAQEEEDVAQAAAQPSLLESFRQKRTGAQPAARPAARPAAQPAAPMAFGRTQAPRKARAAPTAAARQQPANARPAGPADAASRVRSRKARTVHATGTSTDYEEAQRALERALKHEGPSRDERGYAVGTCPDMCPALERYRRMQTGVSDSDGHLWHFEMTSERPDHGKMIKEYRKEAADSNVEGASLLRPPHVLVMTMNYLMRRILPLLDTGELVKVQAKLTWFDFVSDRLRAVRKDIKTQNLATLEAVGILEQCIRFHIAAAYRLSSCKRFDRKLNDDRIKDSFGMLEGCYSDLRGSIEGEIGNEAEMRSYQLLRALGRPSVLVKVSQGRGTGAARVCVCVGVCVGGFDVWELFRLLRL